MKKITYLLFLFQSLLFYGQTETIQVGNAPNVFESRGNLPFQVVYGYNYSQTIYHASEIGQAGYITRLEWHTSVSSAVTYSAENSVIYIGTTTKTGFDSTTDWIPISQLTEVYQGGTFWGENTWGGMDLTTPFFYNGVDNLVIAFDDNDSSWQPSNSFLVDDRPENRGILKRNDNSNPDPNSPGTANFIYSYIPNTKIRFEKNDNCSNALGLFTGITFDDAPLISQNNAYATASMGEGTFLACGLSFTGRDLWYKATVPSSGMLNIETRGAATEDTAIAVYTSCGNTLYTCDDNFGIDNHALVEIDDINLAGQEIYIQVFGSYNSEVIFDIAAYHPSAAVPGTALSFDGIDDAVNCGNNVSLQITGNAITVEAMIKINSFKPNAFEGNIVNKEQTNQANGFMLRTGGSGILEFYCGNGSWDGVVSPSNTLQIGVWHHVAATYDGNIMRLYVDGNQVASVNATISISNSNANLFLGDWANGGRNLDAEMDEVRLWNVARTAQQIIDNKDCELFGNESGLVAYYQFNQGITGADNSTENNVLDSGPNTNNGVLQNFTLNGPTSNWSCDSVIVSGSSCSTLSIDDMAEGGAFSIYPNPTQGILNIKGFDTIESVSIYDINGRLTKKFNEVSNIIDISNLPIGFYFVSVINQSVTKTFKIMKE